jgi:hypothetical protein
MIAEAMDVKKYMNGHMYFSEDRYSSIYVIVLFPKMRCRS